MHNKAIFALAGVFLAVALIVPPAILISQNTQDVNAYSAINNPGHQTSGNFTEQDLSQARQTSYVLAGVFGAVFVSLFVVTMYYGVNHVHPGHKPPAKE